MNTLSSSSTPQTQAPQGCAIVVGVGDIEGIGGAVASRFSKEGLHVYVVGRTQSKLDGVVAHIRAQGGHATAVVNSLRDSQDVDQLFDQVARSGMQLKATIYNAAYLNAPRLFMNTPADFIEGNWRLTCLAGLMVGQSAARLMLPQGHGTIIYTGATASMRGKPLFAAFASAKAALRSFVLNLAHELAPQGIHVAHIVIDGVVDGQRGKSAFWGLGQLLMMIKGGEALIHPIHVADNYWQIHAQQRGAWSCELELRPFKEKF
ncbi:MAG: SDR family NAD(P)-dependent oxidoreductase [Aquabacterium sp.]|nr:SDR family NAD(P)-dependent oxidoreductase [Aquabacterium sp.]